MRRMVVTGLCLIVVAAPAAAQDLDLPLAVQVPASARAAGLGGAYLLSAPDADAIFYNPALMDGDRGLTGSLSRFGSASQLLSAAVGTSWWHGGLSVGVMSLSYSAASFSSGAFARGEAGLWERGALEASEQVGVVAYARTLFGFRVGGAARLIDLRAGGGHSVSGAFDVGVIRGLGPLTLGFSAQNLGPDPDLGTVEATLSRTMTAGAATRSKAIGPLDVSLAGSTSWRGRDLHAAGGGVEVSYWPMRGRTFTARVGYRWVEASALAPVTFGLGYTGDSISLDYAVEAVDDGRATHRITLRVR